PFDSRTLCILLLLTGNKTFNSHVVPLYTVLLRNHLSVSFFSVLCPLTQSYLIFANLKEIRKLDENHVHPTKRSNTSVIVENLEEAMAIDFDYENRIIFWSDIGLELIRGL